MSAATMADVALYRGDCLDVLRGLPDNSVDSVVTDPPYGLSDHQPDQLTACLQAWLAGKPYEPKGKGFMGKSWDAWVPGPEIWRETLRVLKPGGHLLAFAGTRSMDLMGLSLRLAGFELRDSIGNASDDEGGTAAPVMAWVFGSGFPKSLDVSKAIDKAAGAERPVVGTIRTNTAMCGGKFASGPTGGDGDVKLTVPATAAACQWQGWGTALKPAWEPILLARKPLIGTVAENVLAHGTGALNIDACRVGETVETWPASRSYQRQDPGSESKGTQATGAVPPGRWPANVIHDGSAAVLAAFPEAPGQSGAVTGDEPSSKTNQVYGQFNGRPATTPRGDFGSAARFFYCAKASRNDRNEGVGSSDARATAYGASMSEKSSADWQRRNRNHHPTVKPTDLMRYLCRLVTPPRGVILDPFAGSGSTGKAAILEGFRFIGCELSADYLSIATARIAHAARTRAEQEAQQDLFGDAA